MDETMFWQMIEQAKTDSNGDIEEQEWLLFERLAVLEPSDIIEFDMCYFKFSSDAYRRDLWGAAYIVRKGCGDSCFFEFRAWLIAQGRDVYFRVMQNPEALGDVVTVKYEPFYGKCAEITGDLWAVAGRAYEERTGERMPMMARIYPVEPAGESRDEDLPRLYPALYAKFWDDSEFCRPNINASNEPES